MSDPYPFTPGPWPPASEPPSVQPSKLSAEPPSEPPSEQRPADAVVRPLLWVLFAVFLALDGAVSLMGLPLALDVVFGAGAVGCLILLGLRYWKSRR